MIALLSIAYSRFLHEVKIWNGDKRSLRSYLASISGSFSHMVTYFQRSISSGCKEIRSFIFTVGTGIPTGNYVTHSKIGAGCNKKIFMQKAAQHNCWQYQKFNQFPVLSRNVGNEYTSILVPLARTNFINFPQFFFVF